MLPQFDKDLHKVVNESVSLLPDKPDNELYKSFLTVANDSSGFLKLLFSKSQQKNNSIAALAGSYVLIEAITMWKMASFKNFSLSDYHNLFWTLSFQEFLRVNGQNQISFDTFKQILVISSKNYQKVKLPSPGGQPDLKETIIDIIESFVESIDCRYKETSISGLAKKLLSYCEFVNDYLESCWNNDEFKLLIDPNEDLYAFITQNYPLPISYQNIVMEKLESPKKENNIDAKKISLETIQLMLTAASTTYFPDTKISFHFSDLLTLPYQTNRYQPKREDILSYKRDCAFLYMALTDCLDINGYQPQIRELVRKIGEFRNTPEKLKENQKAAEYVFSLVTEILICYLPLYMKTAKGMKIAEQFKQLMFKNNPDFTSPQSFLKEFLNLSNPHEAKSVIFTETVATSLLTKTDHQLNDKMLKEKVKSFSFTIYAFSQSISCSLQNLWLTVQDLKEEELGKVSDIEERIAELLNIQNG